MCLIPDLNNKKQSGQLCRNLLVLIDQTNPELNRSTMTTIAYYYICAKLIVNL